MKLILTDILARLDPEFGAAYEQVRRNPREGRARMRDARTYLARAQRLAGDGYAEESFGRLEDSQVASARALEAMVGGRLTSLFRGRAHVVRKHFLHAALSAANAYEPGIEILLRTSRLRNLLAYEFEAGERLLEADVVSETTRETNRIVAEVARLIEAAAPDGGDARP